MDALKDKIEGVGELESWEEVGDRFPVEYFFEIITDILERPGFPQVAARRHGSGFVQPLSGKFVTEGYYRLFASDGEILKVENVALGEWVILDS
jgi:hypothetical protein